MIPSDSNDLLTTNQDQRLYRFVKWYFNFLLTLFCVFTSFSNFAQEDSLDNAQTIVYYFQLKEEVAPPAFLTVKNALTQAEELQADIIVMELNTYGGLVNIADSIRTAIMNAKPTTVAWINNNAASAGALISIACDSIYMNKGANIGASTVVNEQGDKMPDKYQSYMRSIMRSTAEAKGRNPLIAEAMVDEHIVVPGLIDSLHVLTMTTSEAIENGYCQGEATSLNEVLSNDLGLKQYELKKYKATFVDKIIGFLINPVVNSLLMLLIMGGIWFELQSPGVGFPLIAALIGAILYFAPLYLEGLANNWEIALFFVGLILLLLEVLVVPGFGILGVLGIIALVVSLTFSLIDNKAFEFSPQGLEMISQPLFRISLTLMIMLALFFSFGGALFKSKNFQKLILHKEEKSEQGYTVQENRFKNKVGLKGIVVRECKPLGKIELDGEQYEARSEHGWLDRGQEVIVTGATVNNLIVRIV